MKKSGGLKMKKNKDIYPVGGFPKDKFGFPHYEEIQKTNLNYQKYYQQLLEKRKIIRREARGTLNSNKWQAEASKIRSRLFKMLNLNKRNKNQVLAKPVVSFKTNFKHKDESFALTKFEVSTATGCLRFTEVYSNNTSHTNLCLLIPNSGPGHVSLQSPQEIINEYLPLLQGNNKILIPHFDSLSSFSSTYNKGLLIQGRSQLGEMIQETITFYNHYLTISNVKLNQLIVVGKNVGATVALILGALSPEIKGVVALDPVILGKESIHEALMIPYFNRITDMEEIIAVNLNQKIFLTTKEKMVLPKSKNLTLIKSISASHNTLNRWIKHLSPPKNSRLQPIPLEKIDLGFRKFNITKMKTASQWNSARVKLLAKYRELCALPKKLIPLAVEKVGESILEDSIRTEYHVQTSKYSRVNLTFYQPIQSKGKCATVLCLPGSGSDVAKLESQYVHEVIAKGWNAISIDARARLYDFYPSIPESTSLIAQSIFDILVCCDWIFKHPLVDKTKVATMGLSQGATHSWMLAALEPRITAAALSCGFCTYESVINEKVSAYYGGNDYSFLDSHSIYYYIPYLLQFADQQDLCALIAPRPLMLLCADHDNCFPLSGVRKGGKELRHIYQLLKATDNYKMVEFVGPHSMPLDIREKAYAYFKKIFGK